MSPCDPVEIPVHGEMAVRALYAQLMDGWNCGNAQAFSAPFDDVCDLVAFDGMHFRGRREIGAFHQPLFDKWLRGTRLAGRIESVRFLGRDVALVHARGGTILRGRRTPARERASIQTMVAVRRDGRWRLVAFQNTRVRPMSAGPLSAALWLLTDWLWRMVLPRDDVAEQCVRPGGSNSWQSSKTNCSDRSC